MLERQCLRLASSEATFWIEPKSAETIATSSLSTTRLWKLAIAPEFFQIMIAS